MDDETLTLVNNLIATAQREIGGNWLDVVYDTDFGKGCYIYQGNIRIYPLSGGKEFCVRYYPDGKMPQQELVIPDAFDSIKEAYDAQILAIKTLADKLNATLRNQSLLAYGVKFATNEEILKAVNGNPKNYPKILGD